MGGLMIKKLLNTGSNTASTVLSMVGGTFGLFIVIIGIQLYLTFSAILVGDENLLKAEYIVVNKKVNLSHSLGMANAGFSEGEIANIKKQKGVAALGVFKSNSFKASAFVEANQNFLPFYTEIFFESLPNQFLDVDRSVWYWSEGLKEVPIVVPNDYINLYNFGFAPSQGLPQIAKGAVSLATFNIRISGQGQQEIFKGRIVGFTSRINSILVPENFLDFANQNYGGMVAKQASRIIIESENQADDGILKFLSQQGYEWNNDALKHAKFASMLLIGLSILLSVAAVIVLLSLLSIIQHTRLLIAKNNYNIKTLIQLGYQHQSLASIQNGKLVKLFAIVCLGALAISFIAYHLIAQRMLAASFEVGVTLHIISIAIGLLVGLTLYFIAAYDTSRQYKLLATMA